MQLTAGFGLPIPQAKICQSGVKTAAGVKVRLRDTESLR